MDIWRRGRGVDLGEGFSSMENSESWIKVRAVEWGRRSRSGGARFFSESGRYEELELEEEGAMLS